MLVVEGLRITKKAGIITVVRAAAVDTEVAAGLQDILDGGGER